MTPTTPPTTPDAVLTRRRLLRIAGAGALTVGAGGVLAACGGSSSSGVKAAATVAGVKTGKVHNLVLLSNEWNTVMTDAAQRTAKILGLEYSESNFNLDETVALDQAESAIAAGAQMIVIQGADGSGIPQLGRLCESKGVFLSNMNATAPWYSPIDAGSHFTWFFTQADWTGFYESTKLALKTAVDANGGKATVLHVAGLPGSGIDAIRTAAVKRAVADTPGATLKGSLPSDWSAEGGQKVTEDLISRYGLPNAIVSQNDGQLTGVLAALRGQGKEPGKDVVVCGCDGATDILKEVDAGGVTSTSFSSPAYFGVGSVVRVFDAFNGYQAKPTERQMAFNGVTVTKDNAAALIKRYVDSDALPFDPTLMSRTTAKGKWDPQVQLTSLDVDAYFADTGAKRPAGYKAPAAYAKAEASGQAKAVDAEYAKAYRTKLDDGTFKGVST